MGESELKIALRREGEEKARTYWQAAEDAVDTRRREVEAALAQLREETDRRLQSETTLLRSNLLFVAQEQCRKCELLAEAELEKRLLNMAKRLLPELVDDDRERIWSALAAEIPEGDWVSVKVSHKEEPLAKESFPAAKVDIDDAIGGGMIVTSGDSSIRIDNSMLCRLLRAWVNLLPGMMSMLRKEVENNETP